MNQNLNMNYAQKTQRCKYAEALEEERRKIMAFQRELPLCLELVSQAIEACKKELSGTTTEYVHAQSECSEQTTGECGPVLEEFMPIKRSSSCEEEDEHESRDLENSDEKIAISVDHIKKSDWLRYVQLWNPSSDPVMEENVQKKETVHDVKRNGSEFAIFQPERSLSDSGGGVIGKPEMKKETEKDGGKRKQRRCWSPELHRRFINALQKLGGSHVATPKQIKELMEVDGLTNDEVKSHLQKFRLHTKRPVQTVHNGGDTSVPARFVVVGGMWVPQPEQNQMKSQPLNLPEERSRGHVDGVRCSSLATLSSTCLGVKP